MEIIIIALIFLSQTLSLCPVNNKIEYFSRLQSLPSFSQNFSYGKQTSQTATLTPLSSCTKGRITYYTSWADGGSCNYGPRTDPIIPGYMFGAAPNAAFFDKSNKCGICYEMVGLSGTLRFRVDNSCPATDVPCNGSMIHFDLSENAFPYVSTGGVTNVTFRMVACDYKGKIKITAASGTSVWWFSFVVSEHTLGVKSVLLKDSVMTEFITLNRTGYNTWPYKTSNGVKLEFPVTLKIYSINGDYVTATVKTPDEKVVTEADGNFVVPKDQFFDVEKLNKVTKPTNNDECCTLWDDYSVLYKDGVVGTYKDWSYKSTRNLYSTNSPKEGKYCLEITMNAYGGLQLGATFPARVDQYKQLQFYVRGSIDTEKGLYIKALKTENEPIYVTVKKDVWTFVAVEMTKLNLTNNQFWGLAAINQNSSTNTFSFDAITLVKDPNAPSMAACWDGKEIASNASMSTMTLVFILCVVVLL
ncbi:hypothetical protein EIN_017170 [Entamoeba invadens IP1]|uniref:hypothetical protein n=1 Tax=Entamoeba invadens IP1 TaxID=370355 RepID=UPI0002C3FA9A|nr:hypothetical protein EIN_017170 [Entamoeba invadens IP1]ELP90448.1 hypothetical protein EIN_017170 [Entamoeba invadens IP1]|eukprot:XP_004257219.1 hypothetical protein EIN_017170 [Entamoeba invadens IP1]